MRSGIFASARHATGGGGVTATVADVVPGAISGSGATNNFALTTTLLATDVVVVVSGLRRGTDTVTIGGLTGATWTQDFSAANGGGRGMRAWHTTGITGTGTVTITHSGSSATRAIVYVLRGLTSAALAGVQQTNYGGSTQPSGTPKVTPSQSFVTNQIAILAGQCGTGSRTITIPDGATPATGWTVDENFGSGDPEVAFAHIISTASGTVVGGISGTPSPDYTDCVCLVFG